MAVIKIIPMPMTMIWSLWEMIQAMIWSPARSLGQQSSPGENVISALKTLAWLNTWTSTVIIVEIMNMVMMVTTSPSLARLVVLPVVPLAALPARQPGRT